MHEDMRRRSRKLLMICLSIAAPFVALAAIELALRLTTIGQAPPAFVPAPFAGPGFLQANPALGRRYFPNDPNPPGAPIEVFRKLKPSHGFRVFVLGESTTAGFPFPHNGQFSRIIRDALADVAAADSIEVINLGISATNTFTICDLLPEILDQHPDLLLIYAGHNEYYGAYGVGSTTRAFGGPAAVRLLLRLTRLRIIGALGNALGRLRSPPEPATRSPSRMTEMARNAAIRFDDAAYHAGVEQFASNLRFIFREANAAHVPVFIGTLASNLRDLPPFASDTSGGPSARAVFDSAKAIAARDSAAASRGFARARDLDLVRFRAPAAFDSVLRVTTHEAGVVLVETERAVAGAAPLGVPGDESFFEHVHPRPRAIVILASAFVNALRDAGLPQRADYGRLASWQSYRDRMALTPLDSTIAELSVQVLTRRWPFVAPAASTDLLAQYRPTSLTDSLAYEWVGGARNWNQAKFAEAAAYARQSPERAVAEYAGLMRDQPWDETPFELAGKVLHDHGDADAAKPFVERAYAIRPSALSAYYLGVIESRDSTHAARAEALLLQALRFSPNAPPALAALVRLYRRTSQPDKTAIAIQQLERVAPSYPGLAELKKP
jgi:tetratricopeptide (TPR) repeat protein